MADSALTGILDNYITAICSFLNKNGDKKIHSYFFTKRYHQGCGGHPNLAEHQEIANELSGYIKSIMHW
jgi:hypothetical protein